MQTLSSLRAGQLAGSKRLNISCGLSDFPREIFELADTLETLDLSSNQLSSLPDDLPRLLKLRVIFCSNNNFTELPEVLGQCPNLEMVGFKANKIDRVPASALPKKLRWLILTDNRITELPSELGACARLQKLMLAGNQLQDLPAKMANCHQLELLRIAANRFEKLPDWIPSLPRLAWLAYAGNPCSDSDETEAMSARAIAHVEWADLALEQALGEGASGVIYRAHHHSARSHSPVAVKVFKGALTSDGLPRSEKAACLAAGEHPALIPIVGKVRAHPDNTPGLVMSLIDPSFINLAGPPSLESCTRDIYRTEVRFTLATTLNILSDIASVAAHLHTRGIMHGDLYAHNILRNPQGNSLLGDFGAATFLPRHDTHLALNLQRIEVRAFACLLEELLERCDAETEDLHIVKVLRDLHERCGQPEIKARPLFEEIQATLLSLKPAN